MQTKTFELAKDVFWVGVNDYDLRVFDIIMDTEFGTSYNAYLVKGSEKSALIDTAKANFGNDYIAKIETLTDISKIDYLILNHTEPDHSGSVSRILDKNPDITIIASGPGLSNLKEILNRPFNSIRAKDDLDIKLGDKSLKFYILPNLHWPDTMFTYLEEERILFTCDYFGAHYAYEGILAKDVENKTDYLKSLEYYFESIMSPFKPFVRKALAKISPLDLAYVATSHGPVLDSSMIDQVKAMYEKWAAPVRTNEIPLVVIPYASAYGYTAKMAEEIEKAIMKEFGGKVKVETYDIVSSKTEAIVSRIEKADAFLIGSTTILKDTVKPIWDILSCLNPEIHGDKLSSAFGSYGWSGEAVPNIMQRLAQLKLKTIDGLRIRFNPSKDQLHEAYEFGKKFAEHLKQNR